MLTPRASAPRAFSTRRQVPAGGGGAPRDPSASTSSFARVARLRSAAIPGRRFSESESSMAPMKYIEGHGRVLKERAQSVDALLVDKLRLLHVARRVLQRDHERRTACPRRA